MSEETIIIRAFKYFDLDKTSHVKHLNSFHILFRLTKKNLSKL